MCTCFFLGSGNGRDSETAWLDIRQYSGRTGSTVQYSTIQYSTVQYSTVQYSTVQYSTVKSSVEIPFLTKHNQAIDR